MSATISSAPHPTPAVTVNDTSAAGAKADAGNTNGSKDGTSSFGAMFQQLLGQRPHPNATRNTLLPTDIALESSDLSDSSGGTLAELLPFLESMGLVPTEALPSDEALEEITIGSDALPLAGFASALTPPSTAATAISAAQPETGYGGLAFLPSNPADSIGDQGLPLPKEFSSRFAAALEAAGEKASGTPATANPAGVTFQAASPLSPASGTATPLTVEQPVGSPNWGQEIGNRLVWMVNRTNSHAELVLTPPNMGRVEVSLSVSGDQASASFVSSNPAVREALEAAMPRLREALADAGIQLGQSQVGAENARQSAQEEKNGDNFGSTHNASSDANAPQSITAHLPAASAGLKMGRGLVDVFA